MEELITQLKNDHLQGSKTIALQLLRGCRNNLADQVIDQQSIVAFLNGIDASRPAMTILQYITHRLRVIISTTPCNLNQALIDEINKIIKEMQLSEQRIFESCKVFCQVNNIANVLTHSRSSTVENVLRQLAQKGILSSIICTESRPLNEGLAMANALSLDIKTTIIVDALADSVMPQCDCVFLGADAMDKHGDILNKIGSRLIALSAKEKGVPVICLAEATKIHPHYTVSNLPSELHCPSELGHTAHGNVQVLNQYFEVVENTLLTKIISDQGLYH